MTKFILFQLFLFCNKPKHTHNNITRNFYSCGKIKIFKCN